MLRMSEPILVQIIGAPIACNEGVKDTWREVAGWASRNLHQRFGEEVRVQYFDLMDPACPRMPSDAQLPLVLVNGDVLSNGGKISVPVIRRKIDTMLERKPVMPQVSNNR
jgi:disulfide oxidoreductase YuzD